RKKEGADWRLLLPHHVAAHAHALAVERTQLLRRLQSERPDGQDEEFIELEIGDARRWRWKFRDDFVPVPVGVRSDSDHCKAQRQERHRHAEGGYGANPHRTGCNSISMNLTGYLFHTAGLSLCLVLLS